jgi:hypothetical protein
MTRVSGREALHAAEERRCLMQIDVGPVEDVKSTAWIGPPF